MRLLQQQSDGVLRLTEDRIDKLPPYAILSHTWGADDQEVTLQDIQNHAGQHKEGYEKLTFCGKQAAADGLHYFWVDTCCIDKSSSAELTEAINSMFRWYQNAAKCYVYLPDVSLLNSDGEETTRATWEPVFRKSRWFTRGWTLQELIAPNSLTFFSAESRLLGDKASLETLLHEITRIPIDALRGSPLADFSINDRFSWLGNRQTKRAEDRAYSLFGLFNVHLPLIYGEGETNALSRLRQVVGQCSLGSSQTLSSSGATSSYASLLKVVLLGKDKVSEIGKKCIADLRVTEPRHDKARIQETKGGLLADSYVWVLDNSDFRKWYDHEDQRLLWVKGNPGKGKTMLLCGIIDHLETACAKGQLLSYFFCQATDERINTATAVVRGLISMLLDQDVSLISHLEQKYETAGKKLFEDTNAWQALSNILTSILRDPRLYAVYLIVDALDECVMGLEQLLDLIVLTSQSTCVKWLFSSRNWPQIEEQLRNVAQRLSLEVNEKSVTAAVDSYIAHKVSQLVQRKGYRDNTAEEVRQHLSLNADGTFLWVSLVCQELEKTRRWNASKKVKSFPSGLDSFYQRMMQQIRASEDVELCTQVLALLATTYRPPSLVEFTTLIEESFDMVDDPESLQEIVSLCGSFLTIREGKIYFVHQSAKDFLMKAQSAVLFPEEQAAVHGQIFSKSIEVMSQTLKRDIYGLCHPGFPIESVTTPSPDPLVTIGYSCLHWVNHLIDSGKASGRDDVQDGGSVHRFLQSSLLYWLESLSLLKRMSEGVLALERLIDYIEAQSGSSQGQALARDAYRFLQSFRVLIESRPLQTYASALVFSPRKSLVRGLFLHEAPNWVQYRTKRADQWSPFLAALEGHTDEVNSAAFSTDGRRVITASDDKTSKIWDAATGKCEATLEGHAHHVKSAVFSPDGRHVVTASHDETAKVWAASTGKCEVTLEGHTASVNAAAFSTNGRYIVTASHDKTAKIWDAVTGKCEVTLEDHTDDVKSAVFSVNGRRVVTASRDETAKVWDVVTGNCETTLKGHAHWVNSAAFSADGQHIVTSSHDETAKIWAASTGKCEVTLEGHTSCIRSAAFSANDRHVITASDDTTAKVWDVATGKCEATLEGHTHHVNSATFSADGRHVVTASHDKTAKVWDAVTGKCEATLEGDTYWVNSAAFSADGRHVVTASHDKIAKIWDMATYRYEATLDDHTDEVRSTVFSADERYIVTASRDKTAKVWDVTTGKCKATLEGHTHWVNSATFSADGRRVITASHDKTAKVWDVTTGKCEVTLEGHAYLVRSAAFLTNGSRAITSSDDNTAKVWDATTGKCEATLKGHTASVNTAAFSTNGRYVVTASHDKTAKVWDAATGKCEATLEGHTASVNAAAFSTDGRCVVTASRDKTAKVWDVTTGKCETTLEGHTASVNAAAFSADGQRIVTASRDETVKVWNSAAGKCEATVEVGYSAFISFDITGMLVYNDTGTIRIDDAVQSNQFSHNSMPADQQDYGLSRDRVWVQKQSQPVLWLPLEYRPSSSAVSVVDRGTNLVLGSLSGRVCIFHFPNL